MRLRILRSWACHRRCSSQASLSQAIPMSVILDEIVVVSSPASERAIALMRRWALAGLRRRWSVSLSDWYSARGTMTAGSRPARTMTTSSQSSTTESRTSA